MTYTPNQSVDPGQLHLVLEGAPPDAYVVVPLNDLLSMMARALHQTRDSHGHPRPGRASTALVRMLISDHHLIDTVHLPKEPT